MQKKKIIDESSRNTKTLSLAGFAKEPYKRDFILQKRHIFLRSLLQTDPTVRILNYFLKYRVGKFHLCHPVNHFLKEYKQSSSKDSKRTRPAEKPKVQVVSICKKATN